MTLARTDGREFRGPFTEVDSPDELAKLEDERAQRRRTDIPSDTARLDTWLERALEDPLALVGGLVAVLILLYGVSTAVAP